MSCNDFIKKLSSGESVPGGGGASALCGAMCAALCGMVCNLTIGRKKYVEVEEEIKESLYKLTNYINELMILIEKDAECFIPLSKAYSLPKNTEQEIMIRNEVLEKSLYIACQPPAQMLIVINKCLDELPLLAHKGSRIAVSDVGVAAAVGKAAINGACLNVYINTKLMTNRELAEKMNKDTLALVKSGNEKADIIYSEVERMIL